MAIRPVTIRLPSGAWYLPDLWLPDLRTYIEVKGAHMERAAKPEELAEGGDLTDVIVLLGFPPVQRSVEPYLWDPYMQWRDPLQYDTRSPGAPRAKAGSGYAGNLPRLPTLRGHHHRCPRPGGRDAIHACRARRTVLAAQALMPRFQVDDTFYDDPAVSRAGTAA